MGDEINMRAEWREHGLCRDCGGVIDRPDQFIRCPACREKFEADQRAKAQERLRKKKLEQDEKSKAYAKHAAQMLRCERCDFATFVGISRKWFCPLPFCVHDMTYVEKEETENAEG